MTTDTDALVATVREDLLAKVLDNLSIGGPDSCWEWKGSKDRLGYGMIWDKINKRSDRVQRVTYRLWKGPIPTGYHIDHLCQNPPCANPRHLEAVTPGENVLRGTGVTAQNALKTHCPKGHEYTPENTKVTPQGWRECRICKREQLQTHRARHPRRKT
jgi:HNH endonuclease